MEWSDWQARIWRGKVATVARAVIPTGYRELDRVLPGGGWPLEAITEILVDGYGIGELGLLMPALAALTRDDPAKPKKWVSWIAPPFVPYAPAHEGSADLRKFRGFGLGFGLFSRLPRAAAGLRRPEDGRHDDRGRDWSCNGGSSRRGWRD